MLFSVYTENVPLHPHLKFSSLFLGSGHIVVLVPLWDGKPHDSTCRPACLPQPMANREANRRPGYLSEGKGLAPVSLPGGEHFLQITSLSPHNHHREEFVYYQYSHHVFIWLLLCLDRISDGICLYVHDMLALPFA